ncbi:hypothetical protein FQN54_007865 [Arachnomyces sp. PD_36]|nr:hypothetical protein FQN54_007865 [Arachnomyces sp. PD_36]
MQFLLHTILATCLAPAPRDFCSPEEPFDPHESTIASVHEALFTGVATCRDIVSSFISRIEEYNPTINAIISLNPAALDVADEIDYAMAAETNSRYPLLCVPVLLKDNYDAAGMNTTSGCLALRGTRPANDAPTVTALRNAGAIILGKTNLHELALEGISVSSLGGQTLNPYDLTRTPGGSSGGTGAAIAASFAVVGTGTDTVNSLRSPASANNLFSIRPTRGLISRSGVIPVSYAQDSVGPIARSIDDVASALTVMAGVGYDKDDNTTALIPASSVGVDYSLDLHGGSLRGVRLGVLEGFFNRTDHPETSPVNDAMDGMIAVLQAAGVEIIYINDNVYNASTIAAELDVQKYELRESVDSYLQSGKFDSSSTHPYTLSEIYNTSNFFVLPSGYSTVRAALTSSTSNATYTTAQEGIKHLRHTLHQTFKTNSLDAIIYPEQKNLVVKLGSPSQSGRNGILAALTGSPVVTIPVGFSPKTEDNAPVGVPIGMEILGVPWSEKRLLNLAALISDVAGDVRQAPVMNWARKRREAVYKSVPTVVPNRENIRDEYPIGRLS